MFSGIVEECATLVAMVKDQENVHFPFKCSFVSEVKIDQSGSHNGVCLTVVSLTDDTLSLIHIWWKQFRQDENKRR